MHILIGAATDYGGELFGGIASYILDVAEELNGAATVTLLGVAGTDRGAANDGMARRLILPAITSSVPKRAALASAILLRGRVIRGIAPDVQYAHSPEIALAMSIANPRIPLVVHVHGTESTLRSSRFRVARSSLAVATFGSLIQQPAFARAQAIIVTADKARYAALLSTMPARIRVKCVRIPAMVKTERYRRPLPHRRAPDRPLQLIAIGRLVPRKGFDMVMRALERLRVGGTDAVLKIVGDGPEKDRLERLASKLRLEESVEFCGYVPRDKVAEMLWDADVYVSGSVQEGFSMTLLESLASGVPVVGFDVGGIADVVTVGTAGVLATDQTPESLAEAIVRLLPISDTVRQECARVAEMYSSRTVAGQVLTVLEAVAGVSAEVPSLASVGAP